jgi:hypothetical protein
VLGSKPVIRFMKRVKNRTEIHFESSIMTSIVPTKCALDLVSDSAIEQYWFYPDENVSATLGTKGGPVCAPIFKWKVLANDSIEIFDGNGPIAVWQHIRLTGDSVHVEHSGQTKIFKILNAKS